MNMRRAIRRALYRRLGGVNFVRWHEWRTMMRWLDPAPGETVLDVACGWGGLSLRMAALGCRVIGIDLQQQFLDDAQRLAAEAGLPIQYKVGDAERLPFPDNHFPKVVCSSSLEHMGDDRRALREMWRVLRPGGRLVLSTDSLSAPLSNDLRERHRTLAHVVHYYTDREIRTRLEETGFLVNRVTYLFRPGLPAALFGLGIRLLWGQRPLLGSRFAGKLAWAGVSVVADPLVRIGDRLTAGTCGQTLVVQATKPAANLTVP